jgi:tetratricopeptide (TPR) repeat protein
VTPAVHRLVTIAACAACALVMPARRVSPQASQGDVAALEARLRDDVASLRRAAAELAPDAGTSRLRAPDPAVVSRHAAAEARVRADIERLLEAGGAGRAAVRRAGRAPDAHELVRRGAVRAALADGDAAAALAAVETLAGAAPRDTQLLRWRAEALDALGLAEPARAARQARWELAPEDPDAWRDLVAAHVQAGTLAQLRAGVERLRLLYPQSRVLREREIEVLHRLGRLDEAARVAADSAGGSSDA